jgi:L-fuconolactonase
MNRRNFLKAAAANVLGALSVSDRLPVTGSASQVDSYRGRIIDTHTHFYDPTRPQGVPWPPRDDKLLYRRVLPADYKALSQPLPVSGTIVVEASPWLEDNQWILDLAVREPFIVGFVGNLAVGAEDFPTRLGRFASNPLFRGLRIGADRLRVGLSQPRFVDHIRRLASHDLALDLLGGPEMLPDSARLADAVPQLRIVIDHVASARIDGKTPEPAWRDGMKSAAAHPNVFCKISGLVEGTGRTDGTAPADVGFYRPVLDALWELFGEDRLVYGSNWPVSARFASCSVVQSIIIGYFKEKGQNFLEKIFLKNSQQCYRWRRRQGA